VRSRRVSRFGPVAGIHALMIDRRHRQRTPQQACRCGTPPTHSAEL
jgi:hypothetical protein